MPVKPAKNKLSSFFSPIKNSGVILGTILLGLIFLVIASYYAPHLVQTYSQNKKFNAAKARCQKEPFVIVKSKTYLLGGSTTYDLYAPSNPDYQKTKKLLPNPFDPLGKEEVYGYYCSIDEVKQAYPVDNQNGSSRFVDYADNHSAAEQQQIKQTYLDEQKAKGTKFYAPKELLTNFKINAKSISPQTKHYSIGYVGNTPSTKGIGEKEPINLVCQPREETLYGSKVATNRYGGDIYLEEDQYNLNIRSYLPTALCTLEAKVGQIDHSAGTALVSSIEEVDSNIIVDYKLSL